MKGLIFETEEAIRLRVLKNGIAKPMIPIANRPVFEYTMYLMQQNAVNKLIINSGYGTEEVRNHFGDGTNWGIQIWYQQGSSSLGSAGILKNLEGFFGNKTFIALAAGIISDIDIGTVINSHKSDRAAVTVGLVKGNSSSGVRVNLDNDGRTVSEINGRYSGKIGNQLYRTCGLYVVEPMIMQHIPRNTAFDFDRDLLPLLLQKGLRVCGYELSDCWLDINSVDNFRKANFDMLNRMVNGDFDSNIDRFQDGIFVGEGTKIHETVEIYPPVSIGKDCLIQEGAQIVGPAVIGDNFHIDKDVSFEGAIGLGRGYVGKDSQINDAILGDSIFISSGVEVRSQAVIGANCIIGANCCIKEQTSVKPGTVVEKNSVVCFPRNTSANIAATQ